MVVIFFVVVSTIFSMYVLVVNSVFMDVSCIFMYSCIYVYVIVEMGSCAYVCRVSYLPNFELTLCYVFSVFCCYWVVCYCCMFVVVCCVLYTRCIYCCLVCRIDVNC